VRQALDDSSRERLLTGIYNNRGGRRIVTSMISSTRFERSSREADRYPAFWSVSHSQSPAVPHPTLRTRAADLERLMKTLEVEFAKLAECLVSPGWRLSLPATNMAAIHYNLRGSGLMIVGDDPPIPLAPHTLVICPPRRRLELQGKSQHAAGRPVGRVDSHWPKSPAGEFSRFVAGDGEPQIILICGYFRASYGASIDPFAALRMPIVEMFDAADQLDAKLKSALKELIAQEIGAGAMTAALLKQVLITILRRSLVADERWAERFAMLGDAKIVRAFSDMLAEPGVPHTIQSLASKSGMSRSAFMSRFTEAFGEAPMTVLRQLRMQRAHTLLQTRHLTVKQVASAVGYSSRSSFCRAFRKAYGKDPLD
jgi:AraC family transcriptional activator of mtrCDE